RRAGSLRPPAHPPPRRHVVRRRLGCEAEARLGLGQHGERFPIRVILEPRLPDEQAPRAVVPPGAKLGLRALDDEGGVEVRLARGRGEQRLGGVPHSAGEPQRLGALGRGLGRQRGRGRRGGRGGHRERELLLRRPRERRERGTDEERGEPDPGTCRTRTKARWYSARDSGVCLNPPTPAGSWKNRASLSWS